MDLLGYVFIVAAAVVLTIALYINYKEKHP